VRCHGAEDALMSSTRPALIFLALNEVNFEYVRRYVARGHLPAFARLLARLDLAETVSENRYELLEPWIQWVTAHTGLTFAEHRVMRLGDIVHSPVEQIWEKLEAAGLSVAAVSPINAANRTRRSPFFVPDPWTRTPVSGGWTLHRLHAALAQAVGDNAQQRVTASSLSSVGVRLPMAAPSAGICIVVPQCRRAHSASLHVLVSSL
jgi:hypothetical protein